jgi:hypothetical protein
VHFVAKREGVVLVALAMVKAKAVAVASACLYHMLYSSNVLITYIILSITLILTHIPDWQKMDCMVYRESSL